MVTLSPLGVVPRKRPDSFQIMSDLHLETGQQYSTFLVPPCAPYLILAGDIGRLCDYEGFLGFLVSQCQSFQHVFLVLGNHEFFGGSRSEGFAAVKKLEQESVLRGKLSVLSRTRVDVSDSIVVLGCTLQSYVPPESRAVVESKVNDFKKIRDWSVDDHNAEHILDVSWLRHEIHAINKEDAASSRPPRRILVVTHHAPSMRGCSAPQHEANPWASAFATELLDGQHDKLSSQLKSQTWIFGHTHYSTCLHKQGLRLISNQRGYVFPQAGGTADPSKRERGLAFLRPKTWFSVKNNNPCHDFNVKKTIKI